MYHQDAVCVLNTSLYNHIFPIVFCCAYAVHGFGAALSDELQTTNLLQANASSAMAIMQATRHSSIVVSCLPVDTSWWSEISVLFSYHSSWCTLSSCKKWIRASGIISRIFINQPCFLKHWIRLTNSTERNPHWDAVSRTACRELLHLLWNIDIHFVFTRARHWSVSRTSLIQSSLHLVFLCLFMYYSTYLPILPLSIYLPINFSIFILILSPHPLLSTSFYNQIASGVGINHIS